jgi:membrane-associated phospholipid phosphatase
MGPFTDRKPGAHSSSVQESVGILLYFSQRWESVHDGTFSTCCARGRCRDSSDAETRRGTCGRATSQDRIGQGGPQVTNIGGSAVELRHNSRVISTPPSTLVVVGVTARLDCGGNNARGPRTRFAGNLVIGGAVHRLALLGLATMCITTVAALAIMVQLRWTALHDVDTDVGGPAEAWSFGHPAAVRILVGIEIAFGTVAMGLYLILLAAALCARGHRRAAGWAIVVMVGTSATTSALKLLLHRRRPEWQHPVHALTSFSFPSGHASGIASGMGVLAVLALFNVNRSVLRRALLTFAGLLVVVVGADRILLGVHNLSDVVAGYAVGSSWLLAMWAIYPPYPEPATRQTTRNRRRARLRLHFWDMAQEGLWRITTPSDHCLVVAGVGPKGSSCGPPWTTSTIGLMPRSPIRARFPFRPRPARRGQRTGACTAHSAIGRVPEAVCLGVILGQLGGNARVDGGTG